MLAKERQDIIAEMVTSQGAVTTAHLLSCFDVSSETIRKDLLCLEKAGTLLRVHGGAVLPNQSKPAGVLVERNLENTEKKQELVSTAVTFIREGDLIAIGAGSTGILLANKIKEQFKHLTVLTYSLDVLQVLSDCAGYTLFFCGGKYIPEENSTTGTFALDMIERVHVQKAFICPMAVSLRFGISDYREDITQIQRSLIDSSEEVFILADSSKFEKQSLLKTVDAKSSFTYITDSQLPAEIRSLYEKNNLNIVS